MSEKRGVRGRDHTACCACTRSSIGQHGVPNDVVHPLARCTVHTIDGVVPALRLTPGTHEVVYAYRPRSVQIGGTLTLLGLAASGGWVLGQRILRRRTRQHA